KQQAGKILRFDGENPVEIRYNSAWLGTMNAVEFVELSHHVTFNQMIERDMFQNRLKEGQELYMNEFLYPILQGYDSVAMNVDIEIGGTDQLFNMMMGRKLMRIMKQKEKFVITVPLLTDAKGNKIGKTEGNVIGLTDPPNDFCTKIMSLGDDAILPCFRLLTDTDVSNEDVSLNPMQWKKRLAFELTKQFNDKHDAIEAQRQFELRVQEKDFSHADLPDYSLSTIAEAETFVDQLLRLGLAESKSEAKRLIGQGSVKVNDTRITDHTKPYQFREGDVIVVGKKKAGRIKK
ncbi:MAG: tyrosine--tRNA ligase, partial [Patescibacteria group bacterium]|nr:tyrosine--tRNA ligase [Patescibacteria group bacterium]